MAVQVRLHAACPGDLLLSECPQVQALVVDALQTSIRTDDRLHVGRRDHAATAELEPERMLDAPPEPIAREILRGLHDPHEVVGRSHPEPA
jgi:hypothetical protein